MLLKCCTQYAIKLGNSAVATELEKISFHSNPKKKTMPKDAQTTAQLHSSHMLAKECSKFSKPGFYSTWTVNFQMFKLDLEKAEEPDQIANIHWIIEKASEFQKNIYFLFIDYAKAFDYVDHNKLWKILKEMAIPDHLFSLEKLVCR